MGKKKRTSRDYTYPDYMDGYGADGYGDGDRSERRYRLNKRKFAASVFMLLLIVAVGIALYMILNGIIAKSDKSALAENPKGIPSVKPSQTVAAVAIGAKKVVLDAGHGGSDPGTNGVSGVREDEINLKVANNLKAELEKNGIAVIMTREDENAIAETKDADMTKRRQIITDSGSDIVVSIHMNSFTDPDINGPVVIYMPGSAEGERLANSVQSGINSLLKPETACKVRSDGTLYILKSGYQPCIIVECGYLSNGDEEEKLKNKDYQMKVARAVSDGVIKYFGGGEQKISVK